MLLWNEAQPCVHLTAAVKVLRIPDRGDQRAGYDRAGAGDLRELAADLATAMPRQNLRLEFIGLRNTTLPCSSTPCTWNTFFAKSMPTVVIFMEDAPLG